MLSRLKQLVKPLALQLVRLPGGTEALEAGLRIGGALGWTAIYDSAWRHLPHWLETIKSVTQTGPDAPRRKLLVFAYFPELVDYSLALTAVLIGRYNVDVDFAWAPYGEHTETTGLRHAYWKRLAERLPSQPYPGLRLYNLEHMAPAPITDGMREICAHQAKADVSYVLRRERVQIESDAADRRLYEYRQARNLEAVAKVAQLVRQNHYDRVLMANGAITELGAAYRYVAGLGLPISTFEMWDVAGTIVVSSGVPVMNIDTQVLWERDEPHVLSDERRARVQRLIQSRGRKRSTTAALAYQPTDGLTQRAGIISHEQIRAQLGLASDRPVILVCPNVPFDSMFYAERNRNFATMWEWLVKTIGFLAQRPDCQVIVRSHPAEPLYNSDETTLNLVREFFPVLPPHITVVPADAPTNTYAIMQIADLGLVYASTTGLEMPLRGIPVVCGISNQHFNRKGFTIDPESPDEYFSQLERILHNPAASRLTSRQVELAWCYADIFFNQWPLPFPWLAGPQFWQDLARWPLERMLSSEGAEKYGAVFEALLPRRG